MATVTMPQLGESVTEGTVLHWLKQPGDAVLLDDPLCEIETEKVTAELPSPFEGTMGEIFVPEGETVEVGAALCTVAEGVVAEGVASGAAARPAGGWSGGPMAIPPDEALAPPVPAPSTNGPAAVLAGTASRTQGARPQGRERFYSPAVLRLAGEHGVDLTALAGSGIGGRVTRKDVDAVIARVGLPAEGLAPTPDAGGALAAGPLAPYEVVALSATRRTIAENLKRSNLEAPQAWTMVEADVSGLVRVRERERERVRQQEGVDLTLLPYFAVAVCETLREYPMLNARWEGGELRRYRSLNLGIAIAAESGLVVPVIHGAGDLGAVGMAKRIADLVDRARSRKLRIDDIEGGTFTVNNTGAFGSIASKPLVNYPQVAIVTMERVVKRAVVLDNEGIGVRSMVNVCLSFDHRAMDGLEAGHFLSALKLRLEALA